MKMMRKAKTKTRRKHQVIRRKKAINGLIYWTILKYTDMNGIKKIMVC